MKNAQWTTLVVTILLISIQVGAQKFTTTMGPKIPADPQYVLGGLLAVSYTHLTLPTKA